MPKKLRLGRLFMVMLVGLMPILGTGCYPHVETEDEGGDCEKAPDGWPCCPWPPDECEA
jgi:hypothetical protein